MKLTIQDIKIKTEHEQLWEAVFSVYDSLEDLAEASGYNIKTLKKYHREGINIKFLYRVAPVLNKSVSQIVKSKKQQISEYVHQLFEYIKSYKSLDDRNIIDYLTQLCKDYNLNYELVLMERNLAKFYFNITNYYQSIDMYSKAIKDIDNYNAVNYKIYLQSELALTLYWAGDLKKARKYIASINIDDIEKNEFKLISLFKFYYTYGIILMFSDENKQAIKMYKNAINSAYSIYTKSSAISNIGLSYKRNKEYNEAIKWYYKALEVDTSNLTKSKIYNNIAMVYYKKGNFKTAYEFSEKSIKLISQYNIEYYQPYKSYLQIKTKLGVPIKKALRELIDYTLDSNSKHIPKIYILESLDMIIKLAEINNCYDILEEVQKKLGNLIFEIETQSFQYVKLLKEKQVNIYNIINEKEG